MANAKPIKTPMPTNGHLDLDKDGKAVDQKVYHSMIGSLLYLCASSPNIMLSVCMCARFQANPKECHLMAVKRILRYLVHTPNFGLWYPKGSIFNLLGYSDSDYAGSKVERKSTSGTCQFLGRSLVSWSSKKQNLVALSTTEAEYVVAGACCAQLLWMKQTLNDYGWFGSGDRYGDTIQIENVMKAEDIVFAYERRDLADGKTVGLKSFYYAMNNLFREIINPNGGDSTSLRKYAKNLLARMDPGSDALSVSRFIWAELSDSLDDARNDLLYAPYIMYIIERVSGIEFKKDVEHRPYRLTQW
ncbi:uncharacterized mitochondrial protein AtMg00810-like [Miscanthus floridulus]|uniref:uncharacterized mitochondrial protein AtMg00810-like n=1 Tax=Miscanthus floridulus TaxID=154761 RepID=UPI00345A1ABF